MSFRWLLRPMGPTNCYCTVSAARQKALRPKGFSSLKDFIFSCLEILPLLLCPPLSNWAKNSGRGRWRLGTFPGSTAGDCVSTTWWNWTGLGHRGPWTTLRLPQCCRQSSWSWRRGHRYGWHWRRTVPASPGSAGLTEHRGQERKASWFSKGEILQVGDKHNYRPEVGELRRKYM